MMPRAKNRRGLTVKQDKFVREYLKDGNGTRAALASGYSEVSAHSIASENLNKPEIAAEIRKLRQRMSEKLDTSAEKVINDIAHVAEQAAAEGNHSAALKGLELLGKVNGVFVERSVSVTLDLGQAHLEALRMLSREEGEKGARTRTHSAMDVDGGV